MKDFFIFVQNLNHFVIMYRKNDFKILHMNVILFVFFFGNLFFVVLLLFIVLLKDCEVRAGLKSDTWIKVLHAGKVREQQVRYSSTKIQFQILELSSRVIWFSQCFIVVDEKV